MRQSQENSSNDASLLANNMAGLSRQLNLAYRKFQVRAISEEILRSEILKTLNGNYPETLVDPIIKELELRNQLQDQIVRILAEYEFTTLHFVLDADNHISVPETLRYFYHQLAEKKKPADPHYCAIFGLAEFISEPNFSSEQNTTQTLIAMFYLSAIHGKLDYLRRVWELAESLHIEKDLITNRNFSAVAAGRASDNQKINEFIMSCADKINLTAEIPQFSDDEMFPLYARANNRPALLACWQKDRTPESSLSLLTKNECQAFKFTEGELQEETREILLNCLIFLNIKGVTISDDIWKTYFQIVVKQASLSSVRRIWQTLENETLKRSLLDHTILDACTDYHILILKFIIEQAESCPENPIEHWKFDLIEKSIPLGLTRIGELFSNSPLIKALHSPKA